MSECVKCRKAFDCGMADPGTASPCWCSALPVLPREQLNREANACYCPDCLNALLARSGRGATGNGAS